MDGCESHLLELCRLLRTLLFVPAETRLSPSFRQLSPYRESLYPGASTRDLNWKRRGRKKRKNRTDPVSVRESSVNKWEGGDIEMKQGGKSGFRATISGKIDELPVSGQPVLCP